MSLSYYHYILIKNELFDTNLRISIRVKSTTCKFIQWKSYLVRRPKKWRGLRDDKEQRELVDFQSGSVFSRYYCQDEFDPGVIMETTIPTKDIKEGLSEFLEDENTMRIRIQWDYNYQLFQSTFHQYDDVYKYQNQQMRLEIDTLNEKLRSLELLLEGERGQNNEDAMKLRTLTVNDPNSIDFLPITRSPSPVPLHLRRIPGNPSRSPSPRRNTGRKLSVSQFSLDGTLLSKNSSPHTNKAVFRRGNSTYAESTEPSPVIITNNGSNYTNNNNNNDSSSPCASQGSPSPSTPPPLIVGPQRFGISPPLKKVFESFKAFSIVVCRKYFELQENIPTIPTAHLHKQRRSS
ncbi:unnamed protein product [Lepeophtheirus salmonis]|uniref:(salmon louse) hypothetical protein n=1 Tax=Lepeophtheirus salmonis TaxID=72036 RepID=A0A7R8H8G3_LEPSM|nr:unnamed protein product [Lepeophtheirus salmonis]CAF2937876.1 unnamed protein product [Lepeophtheirus salmonis]